MAKSTKKAQGPQDPASDGMVAAMAAFSPAATTAWFEIMQESMRFMNERLQQDLEAQRKMLACTTPQELMQVQSEFMKTAFAQYTQETQRMMEKMGLAMTAAAPDTMPKTRRGFDDVPV